VDIARNESHATLLKGRAVSYRDAARAEELHNLRLALVTFALHLDAFEMRMRGEPFGAGVKSEIPASTPASGAGSPLAKEKRNGGQ
jgi:hypothetical protein